jgi:hypothetical protein
MAKGRYIIFGIEFQKVGRKRYGTVYLDYYRMSNKASSKLIVVGVVANVIGSMDYGELDE